MVPKNLLSQKALVRAGFAAMGVVLIAVIAYSLQFFMERLLVRDAYVSGMRWASRVEADIADLEGIFSGEIREAPISDTLNEISSIGRIYRYVFVDRNNRPVNAIGSYHPAEPGKPARHHAHSHDQIPARTPPKGYALRSSTDNNHVAGGDAQAGHSHPSLQRGFAEIVTSIGSGLLSTRQTHLVSHGQSDADHRHSITLETGNGIDQPRHYAVIGHPVFDGDNYLGAIKVFVDQTEKYALFRTSFYSLLMVLIGASTMGFGIPCFYYFRGKAEADAARAKARFHARHDEMTRLLNRKNFINSVDRIQTANGRDDIDGALHVIDVDHFKRINDAHGHDVGDELLRQISDQMRMAIPSDNLISRIGGDEFAVFQVGAASTAEITEFGRLLLAVFANTYRIMGHDITTSASIGTSVSKRDGATCRELMKAADIALYVVKAHGRNANRVFEPNMSTERSRRIDLEATIQNAHDNGLFDMHFQPLFAGKSGAIVSFEALIRLSGEDGRFISPGEFIPIAEEMGLMAEIGRDILQRATKIAACWPDHVALSVNLSTTQFENGELFDTVVAALDDSGLPAERLDLEITEGLIMQNTDWNLDQLRRLKELGVAIVMDDFGTGYSSLSYLWRFPFDKIKIDQSFVRGLSGDPEKVTEIIKTIVTLGHTLDMTVTAEGVETQEQLDLLRRLDCDLVQGFLLGRPQPADHIAPLLLDGFMAENRPRDRRAAAAATQGV